MHARRSDRQGLTGVNGGETGERRGGWNTINGQTRTHEGNARENRRGWGSKRRRKRKGVVGEERGRRGMDGGRVRGAVGERGWRVAYGVKRDAHRGRGTRGLAVEEDAREREIETEKEKGGSERKGDRQREETSGNGSIESAAQRNAPPLLWSGSFAGAPPRPRA